MVFLAKIDRGYPRKKAGKSRKTQIMFMKGNMRLCRGEAVDVLSCITLLLLMS